jgi:hypothetical protein
MTPLLIDVSRLKEYSVINENVDAKLLTPTIIMVQDLKLVEILGTDLYEDICSEVTTPPISQAYTDLLNNYIEPYLINMVIADAVIDLHTKIANTDIINQRTDNGINESIRGIENLRAKYNSQAENYAMRLYRFLCGNAATYPLYQNANKEGWKIKPRKFEFESTIYTGNKRKDPRDFYRP